MLCSNLLKSQGRCKNDIERSKSWRTIQVFVSVTPELIVRLSLSCAASLLTDETDFAPFWVAEGAGSEDAQGNGAKVLSALCACHPHLVESRSHTVHCSDGASTVAFF
jgi:hypothetical protein